MNFVKRSRKSFSHLSFPCRGVTDVDAVPRACHIDKSEKLSRQLVKCLGSRTNIAEFNQGKVCGEKLSTSGISPWFTYLLSNKKPRCPFPGLRSRYMIHSVNNVHHLFLIHSLFSLLIALLAPIRQVSSAPLFPSCYPHSLRVLSSVSFLLQ